MPIEKTHALKATAFDLISGLLEAFPPIDPASEFYGEDVNGGDVVEFLGDWAIAARKLLDAREL